MHENILYALILMLSDSVLVNHDTLSSGLYLFFPDCFDHSTSDLCLRLITLLETSTRA